MKKEKLMTAISDLSAEFDLEELIERLIFIEKIEHGLKESQEANVIHQDQLKDEIKKW